MGDQVGITGSRAQDMPTILKELRGSGVVARVIRLTSLGRRPEQTICAAAGAAQQRIKEIFGPRRFAQLHSSLELLTEQLEDSPSAPENVGMEPG